MRALSQKGLRVAATIELAVETYLDQHDYVPKEDWRLTDWFFDYATGIGWEFDEPTWERAADDFAVAVRDCFGELQAEADDDQATRNYLRQPFHYI